MSTWLKASSSSSSSRLNAKSPEDTASVSRPSSAGSGDSGFGDSDLRRRHQQQRLQQQWGHHHPRRNAAAPSAPPSSSSTTFKPPVYEPFGSRCPLVSTRYEVHDKVGEGTFGEVYKYRDRLNNRMYALKRVLMENEREGFPITAIREIKILKALDHHNVIQLREIVHMNASDENHHLGVIYMVFPFMEYDLAGLLNRGTEFKVVEVACLAKQLCEGTSYLHENKIIHRDMKVANLLLSKEGVLKIADFGLARGLHAENHSRGRAGRYTAPVCTRWYRPPELLLGLREYDQKIDIWGVGCIIAELFIGKPILQGGKRGVTEEKLNDLDQYHQICRLCGNPSEDNWPGLHDPKTVQKYPQIGFMTPKEKFSVDGPQGLFKRFSRQFRCQLDPDALDTAIAFVSKLLQLDPQKRPSAKDALDDDFFWYPHGKDNLLEIATEEDLKKTLAAIPSCHEFTARMNKHRSRPPQGHPKPQPPIAKPPGPPPGPPPGAPSKQKSRLQPSASSSAVVALSSTSKPAEHRLQQNYRTQHRHHQHRNRNHHETVHHARPSTWTSAPSSSSGSKTAQTSSKPQTDYHRQRGHEQGQRSSSTWMSGQSSSMGSSTWTKKEHHQPKPQPQQRQPRTSTWATPNGGGHNSNTKSSRGGGGYEKQQPRHQPQQRHHQSRHGNNHSRHSNGSGIPHQAPQPQQKRHHGHSHGHGHNYSHGHGNGAHRRQSGGVGSSKRERDLDDEPGRPMVRVRLPERKEPYR